MKLLRRQALMLLAGTALASAADRAKVDMLVRSARPEDLEMPLSGFRDYITPVEHFFVRSHVSAPSVNASDWRLDVEGDVSAPLRLTLQDLKSFPAVELVSVVECAGNGRRFYEPAVAGVQWGNGAVGNGRWRGARLMDVLKRAGVRTSALEVLFEGADVPIGTMPDFQRSIPISKALDPATLLAYEMNGETLPAKHGFPLRAVVPGWAGDSWIKWITSVRVLNTEHDGFWMTRAYRHPGKPVAPGTLVPPELMQPLTSLRIKSVITEPADAGSAVVGRPLTIRGVAWSGDAGPVTAVDVSVDGGRRWSPATLRANQRTRFGWRQWEFVSTPQREAYYTILARARDAGGNMQPLAQEWNPAGYAWNVVPRIGLDVVRELPTRRPETQPPTSNAGATPPAAFRNCLVCHDEDLIGQQRLTRAAWDRELTKMTGWGARVEESDRSALLDYLTSRFGTR